MQVQCLAFHFDKNVMQVKLELTLRTKITISDSEITKRTLISINPAIQIKLA